jgi:dihydrolipoamide dehydrogenase
MLATAALKAKSARVLATRRSIPARRYATGETEDLVVIGGGPGGYVAAIKAAQLGLKVTCIEKRGALGGTCLNVGCIPSKALLHASHLYELTKSEMAHAGVLVDNARVDLPQMMKTKEKTVTGLTSGIELLFSKNKVKYEKGFGRFASADTIEVLDSKGAVTKTIKTKNTIIATGSEPSGLPGLAIDEKSIVSSTGALSLTKIPKTMILVGGGVIGLEMGSVWSRLGTQVTVVEYTDAICAGADAEIAKQFKRVLEKQGLIFKMKSAVKGGSVQKDGTVKVSVEDNETKKIEELNADIVLVAVGRKPYTEGLGLEKIGVKVDKRGIIETDDHFRTGVPGVLAIGDAIKGPMLAHKAEEEGIAAVEGIVTPGAGHVNYNAIPSVIYTNPEVAWVGLTEEQAKAKGLNYRVGKFPLKANSRARTNNETEGLVKFISEANSDRILGVHMIGSNAGELIAEPTLAIEYGASSEDLARTCHAHPTVSEAVKEAAMAAYDKPIHI